jgi:adenylyl- and sulfurtransferase ThiI
MSAAQIAILFSGGIDSTAAAVTFLREGCAAHLLTFSNGAEQWLSLAEGKAKTIRCRFPDLCSWRLLDCAHLFHELAISNLEDDIKRYGNLVCCGCKLAMLAEAIIYCRQNRIDRLADGFRNDQDYYPEQTPHYMGPADEFARRFGISYLHPFYDAWDRDLEEIAREAAVPASSVQPYCLFGRNPVQPSGRIRKYLLSKIPRAEQYVVKRLEEISGRDPVRDFG